jgi:hypothetical protein
MGGEDANDTVFMSVIAVLTVTLACAALFVPLFVPITGWSLP